MRTLNTFGIQFLIRADKLKDGNAPIYARITANGEIVHFSLKQWIDPVAWDQRRGYVNAVNPPAKRTPFPAAFKSPQG